MKKTVYSCLWFILIILSACANNIAAEQNEFFDAASFGKVVTCDPSRKDGCRADRVQPFHVEDVFLESEIASQCDGNYIVPTAFDGRGCIGLQWVLRRQLKELSVQFADGSHIQSPEGVQVQYWTGADYKFWGGVGNEHNQSRWQGKWVNFRGNVETRDDRLVLAVDMNEPVQKIRWIFPKTEEPIIVRRLSAITPSGWNEGKFLIKHDNKVALGRKARIAVCNGYIVDTNSSVQQVEWDASAPVTLKLRYAGQGSQRADQTILSFELPANSGESVDHHSFGVNIEDVLKKGYVYVRDYNVFVIAEAAVVNLDDVRKSIEQHKTVLDRVNNMPDQTFAQAIEKVHHPVQEEGPILLSLAGGNRKFVAERCGAIQFDPNDDIAAQMIMPLNYHCRFLPVYGTGKMEQFNRRLDGGWLPVPLIAIGDGRVIYRQRTFVAPYGKENPDAHPWLRQKPLCVVEISIENPQQQPADCSVKLNMTTDFNCPASVWYVKPENRCALAELRLDKQDALMTKAGRLLAYIDTSKAEPLTVKTVDGVLEVSGQLPAGASSKCFVYIPGWDMKPQEYTQLKSDSDLLARTEAYWKQVTDGAMDITLPDELLTNVIRASQVHCLLVARNEDGGKRFAPWISAVSYGPLESEANPIIYAMDLFGYNDFAARSLEFFMNYYTPEGYILPKVGRGYTMMGTGWHLWTYGRHYELTGDRQWVEKTAAQVVKPCNWIEREIQKTKRLDPYGQMVPEYGLFPPGATADWNLFVYRFMIEGYYYAGLHSTAMVLKEIGYPKADSLLRSAEQFGQAIIRSYQWAQGHTPAMAMPDGSSAQAYPTSVYTLGTSEEIYPGRHSADYAYDAELGAVHLVTQGVLEPHSPEVTAMMNHLEDVAFFHSGSDYPAGQTTADWFNLGGFGKLQPYYGKIPDVYALRDDVKPFIRSYFNTLPALLNMEVLCLWEGFKNGGAWNKTHETSYFLQQTRMMLVMERGDELWLGPFVTNNWMKDGMVVAVKDAPTNFGKVSYKITSSVNKGYIEAEIESVMRRQPKALVIRLRHPDGKLMKAVTVNGESCSDFNPEKEYIRLKPTNEKITVLAEY